MHFQVENLLISSRGQVKLCDLGSATTKAIHPDESWTALQRSLAEDEVCLCNRLLAIIRSIGVSYHGIFNATYSVEVQGMIQGFC